MKASLLITAVAVAAFGVSPALAQDNSVNNTLVSNHCRAFGGGVPDFGFVLGKAAHTTPAKLQTFNEAFTAYLVRKYDLNTAAAQCMLEVVSAGELSAPAPLVYKDQPSKAKNVGSQGTEGTAIVRTALVSNKGVPVVLAYRLSRPAGGAWTIANLSINGKPLVGNFEKQFNDIINAQGFNALIAKINAM